MNLFYYESKFKIKICWGGGGGVGGGTAWGARVSDFFYKESKSNKNFFLGGVDGVWGGGREVWWGGGVLLEGQTNRPKPICPFNVFQVGA